MGFIKPAWASENGKRALKAVEKETTQTILAEIAKNAPLSHIRKNALDKLTDQSLLADVAKSSRNGNVRDEAAEKITDQSALIDVAMNAKSQTAQIAIKKITDQSILADIAKGNRDRFICAVAAESKYLTDQLILADIVKNAKFCMAREAAVEKITDETILLDIAKSKGCESAVRACEKLTDQAMIIDVAKNAEYKYGDIGMMAASKLSDKMLAQEVYAGIAQTTNYARIRMEAADKLTDPILAQEFYADIAKKGKSKTTWSVEWYAKIAIEKLNSQEMLLDVANNAVDQMSRETACGKVGQHDWNGCICTRCQKENHDFWITSYRNEVTGGWYGGEISITITEYKCRRCGKTKTEEGYT
jgi:hypothetical protein